MRIKRIFPLSLLAAGIVLLSSCEARHYEVVERACVEDGRGTDYCRCMRKEMKKELGYQDFVVFSDLIGLGGNEQIKPESILRIMDKHQLTPADFADTREAVSRAGPIAERRCIQ